MEFIITALCHLMFIGDPGTIKIAVGIVAAAVIVGAASIVLSILWACAVYLYLELVMRQENANKANVAKRNAFINKR